MSATYLAFPLRLAGATFATVTEGTEAHAADIATHVLECHPGQRGLAPEYGLPDPSGVGVDPQEIAAVVEDLEPELEVLAVDVSSETGTSVVLAVEIRFNGRGA